MSCSTLSFLIISYLHYSMLCLLIFFPPSPFSLSLSLSLHPSPSSLPSFLSRSPSSLVLSKKTRNPWADVSCLFPMVHVCTAHVHYYVKSPHTHLVPFLCTFFFSFLFLSSTPSPLLFWQTHRITWIWLVCLIYVWSSVNGEKTTGKQEEKKRKKRKCKSPSANILVRIKLF